MKILLNIIIAIIFCCTAKAQNSYLQIDTACFNCIIEKDMGDSTLRYEFNDSMVYQIHINYKTIDKYSSNRRIDINSDSIYYNIKTDCYCEKRLVKRHKGYSGQLYNHCRKTRTIHYVYSDGKYNETDLGWQKTHPYVPPRRTVPKF